MPLQCGPLFITGTIDNVCFYGMHGKYYVRMKSSLTRKRVLKDPKFQLTRVHAALLGEASKIASRVYRLITGERKKHALYREITSRAIYLLKEGKDKETVFENLSEQYLRAEPVRQATPMLHEQEDMKGSRPRSKANTGLTLQELNNMFMQADMALWPGRRRRMRFITKVTREKLSVLGP